MLLIVRRNFLLAICWQYSELKILILSLLMRDLKFTVEFALRINPSSKIFVGVAKLAESNSGNIKP